MKTLLDVILDFYINETINEDPNDPNSSDFIAKRKGTGVTSPAQQARALGLHGIRGTQGLWSKDGNPPATHSTKGGQLRVITPTSQPPVQQPRSDPKVEPTVEPTPTPSSTISKKKSSMDVAKSSHNKAVDEWALMTPDRESVYKQELIEMRANAEKIRRDIYIALNKDLPFNRRIKINQTFDYIGPNEEFELSYGDQKDIVSATELKEILENKSAAGRRDSLASEALTVRGLQNILKMLEQDPKLTTKELITKGVEQLQKEYPKNGVLDDIWKNSSYGQLVSTIRGIEKFGYKLSDVEGVYWDTGSGNKLAGTVGHQTPSDLFIKMKDGMVIGNSLKKDGDINFANLGTQGFISTILNKLPPDDPARKILHNIVQKQIAVVNQQIERDPQLIKSVEVVGKKLCNDPNIAKKMFGPNYQQYCSSVDSTINKLKNKEQLSLSERKFLSRLVANASQYGIHAFDNVSEKYRQIDKNVTSAMVKATEKSPLFKRHVALTVIEGLHVAEHFGLINNPPPDRIITSFGTGIVMNKEKIFEIFELDNKEKQQIESALDTYDGKDPELKSKIENFFADRIKLESSDVGFKANLNIEDKGVTIAELTTRSKGLGSTPETIIKPSIQLRRTLGGKVGKRLKLNFETRNLIRSLLVKELEKYKGK